MSDLNILHLKFANALEAQKFETPPFDFSWILKAQFANSQVQLLLGEVKVTVNPLLIFVLFFLLLIDLSSRS